ncbi:MAG TPA: PEP-CTERM sorting domain-containing protein, partial [Verrucomicrobiae bacterium]
ANLGSFMSIRLNVRSPFISAAVGLFACAVSSLDAQTASENYGLVPSWLGQGNAAVNGAQAVKDNSCVPTSVANGLSYLDAYQLSLANPSPFTASPNTYAAVNSLQTQMGTTAAGTSAASALSGLQSYLSPTGANPAPGVSSWQVGSPLGLALSGLLNANDAVQLGILWGSVSGGVFTSAGGGHFVSLDSINLSSGSGTIGILDPWGDGATHANSSATQESLSVSTVNITGLGNYLQVTYGITYVGPDYAPGDTSYAGSGQTGIIALAQVEAVPEPSTLAMLAAGGFSALLLFRRKASLA